MPTNPTSSRRIADLLIDPHETLEIELKGWLEITSSNDHKATLAKALIALANHGGGFVIIGLEEASGSVTEAAGRPPTLAAYTPDTVNAIATAYIEPGFHCDVSIQADSAGRTYPIISVPGGHSVPCRSKRAGPAGNSLAQNVYYIRRPGPKSESPQTSQEWDALIRRCITNTRDSLVDQIRQIIAGGPATDAPRSAIEETEAWFDDSLRRWQDRIADLPAESGARFPLGHFAIGYQLVGNLNPVSLGDLKDIMAAGKIKHTGWPEFWVPTRDEIKPYIQDGILECWIARDTRDDPAHSDFWRASRDGKFFLIRGFQEDSSEMGVPPGKAFELTTPTWRTGEALLHAASMAAGLGDPSAQIILFIEWTGLKGREVTAHHSTSRLMFGRYVAQQDSFRTNLVVQADQVAGALPELVARIVNPLYELFDFFKLPSSLPTEELARMRSNSY